MKRVMRRKENLPDECVCIFHSTAISGIELRESSVSQYSFGRHMHEEYQVSVVDYGVGTIRYRGRSETFGPQQIAIISPGEVHGAYCDRRWALRSMYVPVSLVRPHARRLDWNLDGMPQISQPFVTNSRLHTTVRHLFQILLTPDSQLYAETALVTSLSALLQVCGDRRPSSTPVRREIRAVKDCRDYIEAHYSEEISIDTLSAISHLSVFHLIRSFKQAFGVPPHAYQIQVRLSKAKADLRKGATPLAAAIAHGFCDQSHFHRHFRRSFGVSPGQYRNMIRSV
jgi:AraC-like DNA-binding protein